MAIMPSFYVGVIAAAYRCPGKAERPIPTSVLLYWSGFWSPFFVIASLTFLVKAKQVIDHSLSI
jgi:hypothetical protein